MMPLIITLSSIFAFVFLVFLLYISIFVRPRAKKCENSRLLCDYAHRGLHGEDIPENSLAAFEKAASAGLGIELDVQLSSDGCVMVFHDYTLTRMTGLEKKLSELSGDELQELKLNGTDEKIPTFSEILKLVDGRVPLLVELKGENFDSSLCEKVASILSDYAGAYCVESFNPLLIKEIKKYLPAVYCGQLYTDVCRDKKKKSPLNILLTLMAFNFLSKPDFISYNLLDREKFPVKLATRLYGAEKFIWTVKDRAELNASRERGEHSIFEKISLDESDYN